MSKTAFFKLSDRHRTALKEHRAQITAAAGQRAAVAQEVARLREAAGPLPQKISRAEARLNPLDDQAVQKLTADKLKLAAIERRLKVLDTALAEAGADISPELRALQTTIEEILAPLVRVVENAVEAHLRAVLPAAAAAAVARESHQSRGLAYFRQCNFSGIVDPVNATREAQKAIDALLCGQIPGLNLPPNPGNPSR